ncbi:hypothetical protein ASF13_16620 [Erwinia sp. Leaf53]|nr:hypothetical protein ASF13_16620 [Erwinia sp. Leaf53]
MYANVFSAAGLTDNFVPGGVKPSVSGTLTVTGGYLKAGNNVNYLDLGITDTDNMTLIVVSRRASLADNRALISNYNGAGDPGKSLMYSAANAQLFLAKADSAGTVSASSITSALGVETGTMLTGRFTAATGAQLNNLTEAKTGLYTLPAGSTLVKSTALRTLRLGGAPTLFGVSGAAVDIAAALVFSRVLTDAELATIRAWLQKVIPSVAF